MAVAIARPFRRMVSLTTRAVRTSSFRAIKKLVDYMVSLLGDNVHRARRNNKIYYRGRYVKYPFENGLFDLDPQDRFECLYHYIKNDYPPPKTNFKEWLYHHFGKGLAEKYLIPYNEKIWNVPAEQLGLEWVEGRVPKPPLEDVIKAAVGVETEGYTHQLYFSYPLRGGIESLPRALERQVAEYHSGFHRGTRVAGSRPVVCLEWAGHTPVPEPDFDDPYPGAGACPRGRARRYYRCRGFSPL